MRNIGFDIARVVSMFYIIAVDHLTGYTDYAITKFPILVSLIWSSLGIFTFLSAFLLGCKYKFESKDEIIIFYKKRVIRFYPLYLVSSIFLLLIGFNTLGETLKGIFGISSFWIPQQNTLWYISMLIIFYLITPILARKSLLYKFLVSACVLMLVGGISYFTHSVDPRFFYYFIIYCFGIITAKHFANYIYIYSYNIKSLWLILVYFALLLMIGKTGSRMFVMSAGYTGAFVIFNICMILYKWLEKINHKKIYSIISYLSFGSMCAYLFHREIFWLLLEIFSPSNSFIKLLYLLLIGMPLIIVVSYYIQKSYNALTLGK